MSQSLRAHKRKLVIFSVFVSLVLHGIEMHVLQNRAFWFSTPSSQTKSVDSWALSMTKKEKNQILKETFHAFSHGKKGRLFAKLSPIQTHAEIELCSLHPDTFSHTPLEKEISFPKKNLLHFINNPAPAVPFVEIALPPIPKKELTFHLLEETPPQGSPEPLANTLALVEKLPKQELSHVSSLPPLTGINILSDASFKQSNPPHLSSVAPLLKIPSLFEKGATSYSSFFDTEIVFLEQQEGSYLFALTLIPKESLNLTPLKQNYCFLIDRSNSIQKERLNSTKTAVKKAIEELSEDDRFNIFVFDQKIEKLSPIPLTANAESIEKAHNFLNAIELGNFFSQKTLYKPLFLTLPHSLGDGEIQTAIMITDGDNLSNQSHLQSLTHDWTRLNQGKVSLYTLGLNDDLHLSALDTLTSLNRGKTISSPTHKGMRRKLLKLMKSIGSPLAKNLRCQAISCTMDPDVTIELFPSKKNAPHLFLNEPYVILGKTNSLNDFVLFVQGNLPNEWLHIKKTISFSNAKKAPPSLAAQFAQSKAVSLYSHYLEGAGPEFLVEAREIASVYEGAGVFE